MKRLGSRLARVEAKEQGRLAAWVRGPVMVVVYPDVWPPEDRAAFDGEDALARDAAIERQTGVRLGPRTRIIAIRVDRAGPV